MNHLSDQEIQEILDAQRQAGRAGWGAGTSEGEATAAYRIVFEALDEDPGWQLPERFADAVVGRVSRRGSWIDWLEPIVLLALVAFPAVFAVASFRASLYAGLRDAWAELGELVVSSGMRVDLVAVAASTLLILRLADRWVARLWTNTRSAWG